MTNVSRFRRYGCVAGAVVSVACFGSALWYLVPIKRYGDTANRINAKIVSLRDRRPLAVDQQRWNECVTWASIASINIFVSETITSCEAMRRFEQELDEKLKVAVDGRTIKWVFDNLTGVSPRGEEYMSRFRANWDRSLREVAQPAAAPD